MKQMTKETSELKTMQRSEALQRMKKLNLLDDIIKQFKAHGTILKSENLRMQNSSNRIPILYELSDQEADFVREWEEDSGNMVYHVIQNRMEFGLCYSFLYVSNDTEEWGYEQADLDEGFPLVYVLNADIPDFSEYGTIGIKPLYGAVLRTA